MKYIVEKQFDKLGDNYNQNKDIEMEIRESDPNIIIEVDDVMYLIPKVVFSGIKIN
jgi:hypothetical protein